MYIVLARTPMSFDNYGDAHEFHSLTEATNYAKDAALCGETAILCKVINHFEATVEEREPYLNFPTVEQAIGMSRSVSW